MKSTSGKALGLRKKGEKLREATKFHESLIALDEAIIEFQRTGDFDELIITLKDRSLTWLHLYNFSKDLSYAILCKNDAASMVEIAKAKKLNSSLAISYFTLAKANVLLNEYKEAVTNYQLALDRYEGSTAERGDYRYHLGEAICHTGDVKRGIPIILDGLQEIRAGKGKVDEFLTKVWETRALMILATFMHKSDPDQATKYLKEALAITDRDNRLVILRKQLLDLQKQL